MGEETTIFRKAKAHKGTIVGSMGGLGVGGVLALAVPYFTGQSESEARQWREISDLKNRVVIIETKLEIYQQQLKEIK